MAFKSALVILLTAFASVNALATPHAFSSNHHRAIAARVAAPAPLPELPLAGQAPARRSRRSLSRRCKPRQAPVASTTSSTSSAAPTTSAEAVANFAPDPSTVSVETTPATTKVHTTTEAPATTSSEEAPATTSKSNSGSNNGNSGNSGSSNSDSGSSSGGFLSGIQTGQGTFYDAGLGACGITNSGTDHIAAVSHLLFDTFPGYDGVNPNNNPICGKSITATYQGKSTTITVTDRCEGCALTDLDFTRTAFSELADFSVGRLSGMTWHWS